MAIDFDEAPDPSESEPSSAMNITPLIDVLLVLLVMLIITIPIQLHSVNMELPAGLPPPNSPVPLVVRIEVTAQNQLLWDGSVLAGDAQLRERLGLAAAQDAQPEIHVHAQRRAKYDTVAMVLSAAQRLGLRKIGVVGLDEYAP